MFLKLCFVLWSSIAWYTYGLHINLLKREARLDPLQESQVFKHHRHRPIEYQVLQGHPIRNERSAGNEDEYNSTNSSGQVSISVPVNGTNITFILNKVNIAHPGLTLKTPHEEGDDYDAAEIAIAADCFYAGGDDDEWVVLSTCTGVNGVINIRDAAYQLEQITPDDEKVSRHKRDAAGHLFVTYRIRPGPNFEPTVSPAADLSSPLFSEVIRPVPEYNLNPVKGNAEGERGQHRVKRRTIIKAPYTVELAIFIDSTLYSYVKERFPNSNQKTKTVEIVMTLVNAVHRLYSDKSLGKDKVGMLVKKIEVLKSGKPSYAKGDIYKYLKNFCSWQSGENPKTKAGHWDHALLLSGHDLWNEIPSKNSTVGLAFVGGMCTSDYSCTINEATTFAAAYIIAHEMGHNFNMKHDGSGPAKTCSANQYIMAPVMSSGATKWSSCSQSTLSTFLKTRGSCLIDSQTSTKKVGEKTHEGIVPGKRFDANEQCLYMYGKGWTHFETKEHPFNNVCREIWCRKDRLLKTPSASALEGTPCGKNKICSHGTCSTASEEGDDDGVKTRNIKPSDGEEDDTGNVWNIIPHDDGKDDETSEKPKACISEKESCKSYTRFLGTMFGSGNFLEGIFNKIFRTLGVCSDECR